MSGILKADDIREAFLNFFERKGHTIYPSDSLLPRNDPTLLFTGAGMNQFKEYFLGKVREAKRAASCQKCLRTGDLENVGKTAGHHTFFEMLGNFSFGDYFKREAILWAWEFLIDVLAMKREDLWVSVYKDDDEAYSIWKEVIGLDEDRISRRGAKDNFWPANAPEEGPDGPCGPCSEIFYGGPDGVEIWNLVFTQFDRKEGGRLDPLPSKNIDTGMGLERIARVIQRKETNFEIDSFAPIISALRDMLDPPQRDTGKINAIADHVRAVTFAIADGVLPSNEERGYVIRKLIRRAFWYGWSMGLEEPFLYKVVPVVASIMSVPYPELTRQREDISQVVLSEEGRFKDTIKEGLNRLDGIIERSGGMIAGNDVFRLYDTYGFPVELTKEIAASRGIGLDMEGFDRFMSDQRKKSRRTSRIKKAIFDSGDGFNPLNIETTLYCDGRESLDACVLKIIKDGRTVKKAHAGEVVLIFLDRTNFYGEKGGQVGDKGVLRKAGAVVGEVVNSIDIEGRVQHEVKVKCSDIEEGDHITAEIDMARRDRIKKNHTATHLLHAALRKVLGGHVKQAGSLVAPDRLRFDFTHFKGLSGEEIRRVEEIVNAAIKDSIDVRIKEMPVTEAKREGATALFGEKYGDTVRVVCVGGMSKELCGGSHAGNTGEIRLFRIISESSVASGIRRIEAITGEEAIKKTEQDRTALRQMAEAFDVRPQDLPARLGGIEKHLKALDKRLSGVRDGIANRVAEGLLRKAGHVISEKIEDMDMGLLRRVADFLKARLREGAFFLAAINEGRVSIVVGAVSPVDAAGILREIGARHGIKGGGRKDLAQAGTRLDRIADIDDLVKEARSVLNARLN